MEERTEFRLAVVGSKEQTEEMGKRRDSVSEKAARSVECRSWKM